MNHIINNNLPAHLNHLVPAYWMNIGFVMTNVKDNMQNNLNEDFVLHLNIAIQTAHDCAQLYGQLLIRPEFEFVLYTNTEQMFYNQLSELINNSNQFCDQLHNAVRAEVNLGTQYFNRFLRMIHFE